MIVKYTIPQVLFLLMISFGASAQEAKALIKKGNENFKKNEFEQAASQYKKSIELNPEMLESYFNLGDAMYRQEKYDEAARYFSMVAERAKNKELKAKAFHNLGNSMVKQQKLKEGVESYKQALLNNPEDDETRFNLAYSMKKLIQKQEEEKKKQEEEKKQQEQQQEEKQEQQQEQQQEEQQQEQEQQQEEQKQEQQEEEQRQQQQQKHEVSREEATRMLEALENKEKKVQGQLKKKEVKSSEINIEKNW